MRGKLILFTILSSFSLSCVSASAVTYNDPRMIQFSTYENRYLSPVVMNYNRNNMESQVYVPQNYISNYGPNLYSSSLPVTPYNITNVNVSPETTNYGQNIGIKYDLNLGSVYGSAQERGDLISSIKNMPLTKIGIGRTVSELTSLYANGNDDSNYWSYNSNDFDSVLLRCGNNIITFKAYKMSYGIDVYAEVSYGGQIKLTEGQISNFFIDLSNKLYEREQKDNEAKEKVEHEYSNSIVINGNNSGNIIYNNHK